MYTVSTNTITEQVTYLKLGFARAGPSVTEERDVRGTLRVLLVVILRTVPVGQLDQSVVVRQLRVKLAEIPRTQPTDETQ